MESWNLDLGEHALAEGLLDKLVGRDAKVAAERLSVYLLTLFLESGPEGVSTVKTILTTLASPCFFASIAQAVDLFHPDDCVPPGDKKEAAKKYRVELNVATHRSDPGGPPQRFLELKGEVADGLITRWENVFVLSLDRWIVFTGESDRPIGAAQGFVGDMKDLIRSALAVDGTKSKLLDDAAVGYLFGRTSLASHGRHELAQPPATAFMLNPLQMPPTLPQNNQYSHF